MHVGFGCMRLSTDPDVDRDAAGEVIVAAIDAGATLLDTAPSYALGEEGMHENERLVARAIASRPGAVVAVCTKAGLTREGVAWVPDGRARSVRASADASAEALGRPLDLLLLHTVDPRTPLATSVRALAEVQASGAAREVGLCNVNASELEEARRHADVAAVQIAASPWDRAPFVGGLVAACRASGISVYAHSPFGGPKRATKLGRDAEIGALARAQGLSPWALAGAGLPARGVVALPGGRTVVDAWGVVRAAESALSDAASASLSLRVGHTRPTREVERAGDVVLLMGIQAAGKSTLVAEYVARGYERLNRDERGGTLRDLARTLEDRARAGASCFVLDNTYATRASRADVVDAAARSGLSARCVWVDTPLGRAQVQAVERLFDRYGRVPAPDELRALQRKDPAAFAPTTQLRFRRDLEPPTDAEGFVAVERLEPPRVEPEGRVGRGLLLEIEALLSLAPEALAAALGDRLADRALVFGWTEGQPPSGLEERVRALPQRSLLGEVDVASCAHPGGPPTCWCRPPLPGLIVPWLRERGVDPRISLLVGRRAHEPLAAALGARFLGVE